MPSKTFHVTLYKNLRKIRLSCSTTSIQILCLINCKNFATFSKSFTLIWIHVSAQHEKSFSFRRWEGGTSWPANQMVAKRERERESQEKRRLKVEKRTKNVNKPAKWKQIPPTNQIHPPSANSPHPNKVCERERERAPWRENCPCSQCIVVEMRAASRQEFPLQIEEKPLALPRRFATRLRGGTSWRRAVRADGRVCCRKRQLATDRQLTTVWQVATSDSRQRATCNVQLCKLVLASIINCNCNCNNNLCNDQSVWQLTTLC